MKTKEIFAIDVKQQLSACMDAQLEQDELELLIDSLLENSSQGELLRNEWRNLYLISPSTYLDENNKPDMSLIQTNELSLINVSAQISRIIENEAQIAPPGEQALIKAEITSIPDSFGFLKVLAAGSAIAASLVLVAVNIMNTQQLLDKSSITKNQNPQAQQIANSATSSVLVKNNKANVAKNNTRSIGKLYKLSPQQSSNLNYTNTTPVNRNYSNLIHKASLKQRQNNKKL